MRYSSLRLYFSLRIIAYTTTTQNSAKVLTATAIASNQQQKAVTATATALSNATATLVDVYTNINAATIAVQKFCNSVNNNDYPGAYAQTSTRYQGQVSEAQFQQTMTSNNTNSVISCASEAPKQVGNTSITIPLHVAFSGRSKWDGTTSAVLQGDNTWKIDGLTKNS